MRAAAGLAVGPWIPSPLSPSPWASLWGSRRARELVRQPCPSRVGLLVCVEGLGHGGENERADGRERREGAAGTVTPAWNPPARGSWLSLPRVAPGAGVAHNTSHERRLLPPRGLSCALDSENASARVPKSALCLRAPAWTRTAWLPWLFTPLPWRVRPASLSGHLQGGWGPRSPLRCRVRGDKSPPLPRAPAGSRESGKQVLRTLASPTAAG